MQDKLINNLAMIEIEIDCKEQREREVIFYKKTKHGNNRLFN